MSGELIFGGRDDDGMVPSSPAAPSVAHQVARAKRKIRVGYMARKRCSLMLRKRADAPWVGGRARAGAGEDADGIFGGVECRERRRRRERASLGEIQTRRCAYSPQRFFLGFPFIARASHSKLQLLRVVAKNSALVRRNGEEGLIVIALRAPKTLFPIAASFLPLCHSFKRIM